ncbi:MAG TPA: GNAT family N-acetyltransferase [Herpetosiphonaceae bacterium]|nr:GNAT family N-acetyltransferase [Herpetosiphonaceae bacterium]
MQIEPTVTFHQAPEGHIDAKLLVDETDVSSLAIIPLRMRIGAAIVPVDGIGGVETPEAHRMRGYARRLLEATVEHMRRGEAALSFLYGIQDFYPKFGYATVGFDHRLRLTRLDRPIPFPPGWSMRRGQPEDLPWILELYARMIPSLVGAVERPHESRVWDKLAQTLRGDAHDECRVAIDPSGAVRGYAWHAKGCWPVDMGERWSPEMYFLGEVIGDSPPAADMLLAGCREWANEAAQGRSEALRHLGLGAAPGTTVATSAQHWTAEAVHYSWDGAGPMVRLLDITRLLRALQPELTSRIQTMYPRPAGTLRIETDEGAATLRVNPEHVVVVDDDIPVDDGSALTIHLPHTAMARLALGGFPPEDLLARLPEPPTAQAMDLMCALFPRRYPYMYPPDRP